MHWHREFKGQCLLPLDNHVWVQKHVGYIVAALHILSGKPTVRPDCVPCMLFNLGVGESSINWMITGPWSS
jgi:hypothetical protein